MSPAGRDTAREDARRVFLRESGWGGAGVAPLAADASFRRYFRLTAPASAGPPSTAVLMDAPPEREDPAAFVRVARHLRALGLSAPRVMAADAANGFVLLEDFGDATFTRALRGGETEAFLYTLAVDALITLRRHPAAVTLPNLPRHTLERMVAEAGLLTEWFALDLGQDADRSWRAAWRTALGRLPPPGEPVLVLRDYHVDNLMLLPGRGDVGACGLLDFQDATLGHPAYDLASLLEDARRDVPPVLARAMRARYHAALPAGAGFDAWFAALAAQRHAKVLGIFTRLDRRDGKPGYLRHIPRAARLFHSHLPHPALAPVRDWVARHMPGWRA